MTSPHAPILMYPVTLTPDKEGGGFVVTFPDVPEAITQGNTLPEALANASEALAAAMDFYTVSKRVPPTPSQPAPGQPLVAWTHERWVIDGGVGIKQLAGAAADKVQLKPQS